MYYWIAANKPSFKRLFPSSARAYEMQFTKVVNTCIDMGHFAWCKDILQPSSLPARPPACVLFFLSPHNCLPPFLHACPTSSVSPWVSSFLTFLPLFLPASLPVCLPTCTWVCLPPFCSPCLSASLPCPLPTCLPAFLPPSHFSFCPCVPACLPTSPLSSYLLPLSLLYFLFLYTLNCTNSRQTLNDLGSCMASSDIIFLFNWILHCWGKRNKFVLTKNPNCLFEASLRKHMDSYMYLWGGRRYDHDVAKDTKFEKLSLVYIHKKLSSQRVHSPNLQLHFVNSSLLNKLMSCHCSLNTKSVKRKYYPLRCPPGLKHLQWTIQAKNNQH